MHLSSLSQLVLFRILTHVGIRRCNRWVQPLFLYIYRTQARIIMQKSWKSPPCVIPSWLLFLCTWSITTARPATSSLYTNVSAALLSSHASRGVHTLHRYDTIRASNIANYICICTREELYRNRVCTHGEDVLSAYSRWIAYDVLLRHPGKRKKARLCSVFGIYLRADLWWPKVSHRALALLGV